MLTLSNYPYWILLFTSLVLIFGSGYSTLFFNMSENITLPIFAVGFTVLFLSLIPAKLEERKCLN